MDLGFDGYPPGPHLGASEGKKYSLPDNTTTVLPCAEGFLSTTLAAGVLLFMNQPGHSLPPAAFPKQGCQAQIPISMKDVMHNVTHLREIISLFMLTSSSRVCNPYQVCAVGPKTVDNLFLQVSGLSSDQLLTIDLGDKIHETS